MTLKYMGQGDCLGGYNGKMELMKDLLCWVVPVGIFTGKETKRIQKNLSNHRYSQQVHLYLIHRKTTFSYVKTQSTAPPPSQAASHNGAWSSHSVSSSYTQNNPLGIQNVLILMFMLNFLWSHCLHSLGESLLDSPDLGKAGGTAKLFPVSVHGIP